MPNSVAKRRSRFAILATLAVVASLFTAALPASAATGDVEFPATFSACVGGATADGGFTDTTGNFADASIDCLKYYGVTTGTTATTYSPGASVTRWQMALFLIRAAGPAGITVPAAASQGFTDIGGLAQSTQDAINQLAALGISKGTSTTTYAPNDIVSRYQMALFLIRFLEVQNGAATLATGSFGSGLTDLGNVSNEAFLAIEKAWDHGITKGTSATAFSPFDAVLRDQMAAFIARTLAHTNARPAGISLQAAPTSGTAPLNVKVMISVRDTAFKPVANALVDVFQAALADKTKAVKADGTCDLAVVGLSPFGGATRCAIDVADPDTDANGNIGPATVPLTASTIWWAWTGTTGATFDLDTTKVAAAEVTVSAAAVDLLITTSTPSTTSNGNGTPSVIGSADFHKFGTTVTWTLQAVDGSADQNAVAKAGVNITLIFDRYINGVDTGIPVIKTATTDATGKAVITFVENDPNTAADSTIQLRDDNFFNDGGLGFDSLYAADGTSMDEDMLWDDDASAVASIAAAADSYVTGSVANATANVYDQYGLALGGVTVAVTTDDSGVATGKAPLDSLGALVPDRISAVGSGAVGQGLTRPAGEDDGVDEVTFFVDANSNDLPDDAISDTTLVFFAKTGPPNATFDGTVGTVDFDLVIVNADGDLFVAYYDGNNADATVGEYWVFSWAATDQFQIAGAPVTQAAFETAIADGATNGDVMKVTITAGIDLWNISTDN